MSWQLKKKCFTLFSRPINHGHSFSARLNGLPGSSMQRAYIRCFGMLSCSALLSTRWKSLLRTHSNRSSNNNTQASNSMRCDENENKQNENRRWKRNGTRMNRGEKPFGFTCGAYGRASRTSACQWCFLAVVLWQWKRMPKKYCVLLVLLKPSMATERLKIIF